MIFFLGLLTYIFWTIAILGYGTILEVLNTNNAEFKLDKELYLIVYGLTGFCIISVLGIIINFFIPINLFISITIGIIGVLLFIFNTDFFFKELSLFTKVLILLFFLSLYILIYLLWGLRPYDMGLYHLQAIKWIYNSKAPLGLANLHGRLGFNSSFYIAMTLIEYPLLLLKKPLILINSIIMFFYGSSILLKIKNKSFDNLSDLFLIFSIIPYIIKMPKYISSSSNDFFVMMIILFIIYLLILNFENEFKNKKVIFITMILSFFSITIKLSIAPLVFLIYLTILFFDFRFENKFYLNKYNWFIYIFFPIVIIIPWIGRNIILSGALVYPSTFGHFNNLQWAVQKEQIINESDSITGWARKPGSDYLSSLNNWDWVYSWLRRFILREKEFWMLSIITSIILFFTTIFKKAISLNLKFKKCFIISFVILTFCIIFWFLLAPDPRFGYGYLFSLVILVFSFIIYQVKDKQLKLTTKEIKSNNYLRYIMFFTYILFCSYILYKIGLEFLLYSIIILGLVFNLISKNNKIYIFKILLIFFVFIFTFNSFSLNQLDINKDIKIPEPKFIEKKTNDNNVIYVPENGNQAWFGPLPNTPYFSPDLKIKSGKDDLPIKFWLQDNK